MRPRFFPNTGKHFPEARMYLEAKQWRWRCSICLMRVTRYHDRHGEQRWRHHPRGRR